jgi:DNA-binding LacI/PurR family transcriptional regulator
MSVVLIAEKAGVSIATVSRVLNNSRRVRPEMVAQVRRAITELGLTARPIRRRSRERSTGRTLANIALLSVGHHYRGWFEVPVIAAVVAEITRVAQELHLGVLLGEMLDPDRPCPLVEQRQVDGALVFIPSTLDTRATATLRKHVPIVRVMGAQLTPLGADYVGPDNTAVGALAGEYLLGNHCRKVAFLTTAPRWPMNVLRAYGFRGAIEFDPSVTPRNYAIATTPAEAAPLGIDPVIRPTLPGLVDALVADRPDGLFVSRDEDAVHVHRLLEERGVRPGHDLLVVSCDNDEVPLAMMHPRPASIDLNVAAVARFAVRRLLGRIKRTAEPVASVLVAPRLVPPGSG